MLFYQKPEASHINTCHPLKMKRLKKGLYFNKKQLIISEVYSFTR